MRIAGRRDLLLCLCLPPFASLFDASCCPPSLSLSLPFWVILVLRTGGFNPAPLLGYLPHPAALSVQFRGSQWAAFPGRGGGCVGEGGGGWAVIVSAGSDVIGLPRLDLPLPLLPPSPPALSIHLTPSPGSIRIN